MYGKFSTCNTHYSLSANNSIISDEYRYLIQQTWNKYKVIFTICYIHMHTNLDLISDVLFEEEKKTIKKSVIYDAS